MKKLIVKAVFILILAVFGLSVSGCASSPPGETAMERRIRQRRARWINSHLMAEDIETVLMLDKPSSLTHLHIP